MCGHASARNGSSFGNTLEDRPIVWVEIGAGCRSVVSDLRFPMADDDVGHRQSSSDAHLRGLKAERRGSCGFSTAAPRERPRLPRTGATCWAQSWTAIPTRMSSARRMHPMARSCWKCCRDGRDELVGGRAAHRRPSRRYPRRPRSLSALCTAPGHADRPDGDTGVSAQTPALGRRRFDVDLAAARPHDPSEVAAALDEAGLAPTLLLTGFERYAASAFAVCEMLRVAPWPGVEVFRSGGQVGPAQRARGVRP